jgi:hypothetical protein
MVLRELINQLEKMYEVHGDNVPMYILSKEGMKIRKLKDLKIVKAEGKPVCIIN